MSNLAVAELPIYIQYPMGLLGDTITRVARSYDLGLLLGLLESNCYFGCQAFF